MPDNVVQRESHPAMADEGTPERRRTKRFHIDVRLRASVRSGGVKLPVYGRASNLSVGGIAAFLPVELVVGEQVELDLILPYSTQPLKVRAIVRNRRSFAYGLEFVDITPAQHSAISRTCGALELVQ